MMFHARFDDAVSGSSFLLEGPLREIIAYKPSEVLGALRSASNEAASGNWVAGYVAYNAAPGFDSALVVRGGYNGPLVWFGVFSSALDVDPPRRVARSVVAARDGGRSNTLRWEQSLDQGGYDHAFAVVKRHIEIGDSYQVNLTFPMHATFTGDVEPLYSHLLAAQSPRYAAHLHHGDVHILSVSPERFFTVRDRCIATRPMKGTAPRGRWVEEDEALRRRLASSEKERAENVMIVDLMRNDLGRIAEFGSVSVDELFVIEKYRSVWQMVSEVSATLKPEVGLPEVFEALFPCGSVTGAPKARTMEIIAEVEASARGVYCGAVGFIPPGDGVEGASFNVAIRTVVIDEAEGVAFYGVGGGVTWGSLSGAEYDEAQVKARVLIEPGTPVELFETIRWENGYLLLEEHLERLASSAKYWEIACDTSSLRRTLQAVEESLEEPTRVRLVLTGAGDGSVTLGRTSRTFLTGPGSVTAPFRVRIDSDPVDSNDPRLFHKLTDRRRFDDRRKQHPDVDDVLCVNELGHVTESTIANAVFLIEGEWYTPPLSDGLLPGILRAELLREGVLFERSVSVAEAESAQAVALINSVQGWRPVVLVSD